MPEKSTTKTHSPSKNPGNVQKGGVGHNPRPNGTIPPPPPPKAQPPKK